LGLLSDASSVAARAPYSIGTEVAKIGLEWAGLDNETIANTFKRAGAQFGNMATGFLTSTGLISPEQAALRLQRNARQLSAAAPGSATQAGMQEIGGAKTFGEAAQAMAANPRATFSMVVDSVITSTPGLAAGIAGMALGPFAGATAAGVTSAAMEYSAAMADVLQDKGVNLTDAWAVSRALRNPQIMDEIKEKGAKRGLIIGAFDGISMGLAGRFLSPAMKLIADGKLTGGAAKRATVAAWGAELVTQAGLGAGGEAAAQYATDEFKPADILLEGFAEGISGIAEAGSNLRQARQLEEQAEELRPLREALEELKAQEAKRKAAAPPPVQPGVQAPPSTQAAPPPGQQSIEDLIPTVPGMPGEEEVSQLPGDETVTPVTVAGEPPAGGMPPSVVEAFALPNGMEVRVFKTSDGFGTGLFDTDSQNYVNGSIIRYKGEDALPKAVGKANETIAKIVPQPPVPPSGTQPPVPPTGEQPPVPPTGEPVAAPGNQPRVGESFDASGWVEQENKINKKTGKPSLGEGRVRYKRTDDLGFEQTVVVQNGEVRSSNSVSPVIELENSSLDFDAPVKGKVHVSNTDTQGITLLFIPDASSNAVSVKMSPRAVQQYKDGVPIEKIAELEFSDAGGIRPDGSRTPHTTVGKLVSAKPKPPAAPSIEGIVLQPRDRSREASRNQVQSIARKPDYERLSFSKTPSGAPIVSMGSIPESQLGRTGTVTTASGSKIPVQYAVVEADEIITSHDIDGNVDKRYGDLKIPGLRAVGGNARSRGVLEAYRRGTAGEYRQAMMEDELHGIDPNVIARMQKPVLVRLMPQESLTPTIGDELNRTDMLEMSPVEQAKTDLGRIDLESLSFDDEGGITPNAVAQFINAMPLEERGKLTDRGMPTKQAYQRLENAIFAQAYEDDALIALFAQAQDPEARLVISALMQAAPAMSRLKGAGNLDIREIVVDAARMIISGKRRGLSLADIAAQSDLTTDPDALIIVKMFADNPRSNKQVVEALINVANIAYQESIKPAEGLFGPTETISRRELIGRMGGERGSTTVASSKGTGAAPSNAQRKPQPGSTGVSTTGEELPTGEEAPEVIPGNEGEGVGAADQEVDAVGNAFDLAAFRERVTKIFVPPTKDERVQIEKKAMAYVSGQGYMTIDEAKKRIQEWKINAAKQGEGLANSDKVVLSLFDLTGEWSRPWEEAGYQVYRFDIQNDPEVGDVNNFSVEFFSDLFSSFDGADVYAILAACPCTDFASSGNRWFGAKDASGQTMSSVALVQKTLATIEYFKPSVWAVENPVGRIERLTGLPPWRASFNPNHFGDPYTKKTLLWGRFNGDMPIAPVEPTEGSKMHKKYGGKSQKTKNARSVTPEGFAYAFFQANNAIDNPLMAVANKYDMLDRDVLKKAIDAGMTADDISSVVDDFYYMDMDWDAANEAILDLIKDSEAQAAPDQVVVSGKIKVKMPTMSKKGTEGVREMNLDTAQKRYKEYKNDLSVYKNVLNCMKLKKAG
jgi:hypothetical protein